MPKISVIVPIYNVEKYLNRCVDSILLQTFIDFELILVDDGSPDNSGKICDEYKKKDNRIVVIHKENGGLSSARNAGLDIAKGDWITFIDSDDWIYVKYLEILYNACLKYNADISVCEFVKTDGVESITVDNRFDVKILNPEKLWCENRINATIACGKLYRKSLWNKFYFPVGKIHEDEYTTYKLLFKCDKIAYIQAKMYYYYTNPNGIMNSKWSPKNINIIEAFNQQVKFFRSLNLKSAEEISFDLYKKYVKSYYYITENGYPAEHKKLKKIMRKFYIKDKNEYKKEENWEFLFKEFFPFEIKIRSYFLKLLSIFKRKSR